MITGYLHSEYTESLSEFVVPTELPRCGAWMLARQVVGFPYYDAMGGVAQDGRIVLSVSHGMVALEAVCERATLLNEGQIVDEGLSAQVVSGYVSNSVCHSQADQVWEDPSTAAGSELVRLRPATVRRENGSKTDVITTETPLKVEIEYWNSEPDARPNITVDFHAEQQIVALATGSARAVWFGERRFPTGLYSSTRKVPRRLLNSGVQRTELVAVEDGNRNVYRHEDLSSCEVVDLIERQVWGRRVKKPGAVRPSLRWDTELIGKVDPKENHGP